MKKLSVLLITYNHESYVRQAIESILMQKKDFDYEIILADDCSTDDTQKILMEYINKYPEIFKPRFSVKNLGVTKNYQRAFKLCCGEYVAILEGDDYWTNINKLTKQISFLDEHRDCVLCFNRFWAYYQEDNKFVAMPHFTPAPSNYGYRLLTLEQLIGENFIGNFSTCVYRNSELQKIDENLFNLTSYDWMVNMYLAQFGIIGYLPEIMSVYRIHSSGTWSGLDSINKTKKTLAAIESYNEFFGRKYEKEFKAVQKNYETQLKTHTLMIVKNNGLVGLIRNILKKIVIMIKMIMPPAVWTVLKWLTPPVFKQLVSKIVR